MKTKALIIFSALNIILFVGSCEKKESPTNIVAKGSLIVGNENYQTINLVIPEELNNSNLKTIQEARTLLTDLSESDEASLFQNLQQNFSGDIHNLTKTPALIVIYATGSLQNISFDKIKGVSTFTHVADSLVHQLFIINNGVSTEDNRFTKYLNFFLLSDLNSLSTLVSDNSVGMTIAREIHSMGTPPVNLYNHFGISVLDNIGSVSIPKKTFKACGDANTESDCGFKNCNWVCDPGEGSAIMNNIANQNPNLNLDTLNQPQESNFRDHFLRQYSKGRDYIDFYLKISKVVETGNTVNLTNFAQHISLAIKLEVCSQVLQNGNDTEIPISVSLRDETLAMINYYRTISKNPELQSILTQIETDFKFYCGQTRLQIINSLR